MNDERLKKYAEMLVRAGGNVQKGQPVVITCNVADADFAHMVMNYAYDAGAEDVFVDWRDDIATRTRYLRAADSVFDEFPQWIADRFKYYDDKGVVYLHISSSDPDLLKGVDPDRMKRFTKVSSKATKTHSARTMANELRWSVIAVPSVKWAKKVFPDKDEADAVISLWEALLKGARADGDNPVADWEQHRKNFESRNAFLNGKKFKSLIFKNSIGTELKIGLPNNHVWAGGGDVGQDGVPFFPNQPTEEIFTAPDRNNVNGKVVASMPLSYQGNLIEGFWFMFKDGIVSDYGAESSGEILKNIIEMDEGSSRLGEVALVANSSPISQMGILFYNTLFDENASSHLALGKGYPDCVKGGSKMSEKELIDAGVNDSLIHVDFMFGTADMQVTGVEESGNEIVIMKNGEYTF